MYRKPISMDDRGKLVALTGIIFGVWIRILPAATTNFPINDGGLFYVMLDSLIKNGFFLPRIIEYNGLSIPFTYPPLAFYLGGWLSRGFQIPLLDLLMWMPAIVTSFTVPAFYYLAKTLLKSEFEAGLATLIFGFMPRALTWMIMGGGLTRSLGELFLILAVQFIYLSLIKKTMRDTLLAIVFSALVVLTHPEATLHTIGFAIVIWLFKTRNLDGVKRSFIIASGVLLVTSVWWVTIINRHGLGPTLSAAQTGDQNSLTFLSLLIFGISEELFLPTISVLGLIGLFIAISRREYLLAALFIAPFILEPRNSSNTAIIPLAMLASLTLSSAILPVLNRRGDSGQDPPRTLTPAAWAFLITLFVGFIINALYYDHQVSKNQLTTETLKAFNWVKYNTPENSVFILITGQTEIFCDNTQEWFPVLTDRISKSTPQGQEWIDGQKFFKFRDKLIDLQKCANDDIQCVNKEIDRMQIEYDYLYIERRSLIRLFCIPRGETSNGGNLILSIEKDQSSSFDRVYFTDDVAIYAVKP